MKLIKASNANKNIVYKKTNLKPLILNFFGFFLSTKQKIWLILPLLLLLGPN